MTSRAEETLRLRFGTEWIEAPLPAGVTWIAPRRDPASAGHADVAAAIDHPMGTEPLVSLLRRRRRVGLVLPDRTRVAGLADVLPAVVSCLERAGGPSLARVTAISGGGSHRPDDRARVAALLPESWRDAVRIVTHDAGDASAVEAVGVTSAGTSIGLNRAIFEQDLNVVIGAIGFHYFAGFTGGRKGIFPGLGSIEAIRQNHRLVLDPTPGRGLHPACRPGNVAGNPVHLDLLEAVRMLDPAPFLVNVLLDDSGHLEGVVAGDLVAAHETGCTRYREAHRLRLDEPVDLVVADAGGYPRDIDLVQAHKALVHVAPAVREGGTIVLAAACAEGVGSPTLLPWFRYPDTRSMEAALRAEYTLNAHTALSLRRLTERFRVRIVTRLDAGLLGGTGLEPLRTLGEAMRDVGARRGGRSTRGVVLTAPTNYTIEIGAS
jgi:nickel-dependent lactate racemase